MKKSLPVLPGSMPLASAVAELLAAHLETIHYQADEVLASEEEAIEPVHQLRVATRRLSAVLSAFEDCLKKRPRQRLRKRLRALRRTAAVARFADVLSIDLAQRLEKSSDNGSAHAARALEWILKKRQDVRPPLRRALQKLEEKEFWRWVARRFVRTPCLKNCPDERLADRAPRQIEEALVALQSAHAQWHELDTFESLHRCRVALKRFRYTLEIFSGCYHKRSFEELESMVKDLQTALGDINDSHEFGAYLEKRAAKAKDHELAKSCRQLAEHYHAKLSEQMNDLEKNWRTTLPSKLGGKVKALLESGQWQTQHPIGAFPAMDDSANATIYHLVWRSEWPSLYSTGEYRAASLETEGFIHCTKEPEKLVEVANLFFPLRSDDELLAVTLDSAKIRAPVKYEDPGCGHLFPHVYGPLNLDAVVTTAPLEIKDGIWKLPARLAP